MTPSQSTKPKITAQEENAYKREHEVYALFEGSGILCDSRGPSIIYLDPYCVA